MLNTTDFRIQDALTLCRCAALAYKPIKGWRDGNLLVREVGDGWCLIEVDETQNVLALRGTSANFDVDAGPVDIADWLTDFAALLAQCSPFAGLVHGGFAKRAFEIFQEARWYMPADKPIWLTGHSLGGALVPFLGKLLIDGGLETANWYTFAAPRVGDKEFAEGVCLPWATPPIYQVVVPGDIVPHCPVAWHYANLGTYITVDEGKVTTGSSWGELLKGLIQRLFGSDKEGKVQTKVQAALGYHAVENYLSELQLATDAERGTAK